MSAEPAGLILTHPDTCLPPSGPFLVVSLARSGNSPESRAVVDWLLESRPQVRHLLITCNREGALATSYRGRPGVRSIVLDEKTDDRRLVMTSSFTNIVLAGDPSIPKDISDSGVSLIAERILMRMLPVRAIISPAPLVEALWNDLRSRLDPPTVVRLNQPVYALGRMLRN